MEATVRTAGPGGNDPAVFMRLVKPHLPHLRGMALRLTRAPEDAEDLLQEMLLKLYAGNADLGAVSELRPWLVRVLRHQFVDWWRSTARSRQWLSLDSGPDCAEADGDQKLADLVIDQQPGPEEAALREESRHIAHRVLAELDERQRRMLAMHYLEDLSLPEMVSRTGVPLNTLKSTVARGTEALRQRVSGAPNRRIAAGRVSRPMLQRRGRKRGKAQRSSAV